jgi:hypothetical protein
MKTRDLVLVASGLAVGYLLVGYFKKSKENAQETMSSAELIANQAKIDKCNEEISLILQTSKFADPKAQEAFMKDAFEACMAKTA